MDVSMEACLKRQAFFLAIQQVLTHWLFFITVLMLAKKNVLTKTY
jgi:hypothetical protein